MADPITGGMAAASLGSTVLGTVNSVAGARDKSASMQGMSQYQAAVARNNAIIAQRNADYAIGVGNVRAENQSYKTAQTIGEQKASFAAHGLDVNSGSPLDVRMSTAELGRLDALTILQEASSKAAGFKAQASNFEAEAGLDLMKSENYKRAGEYEVNASLISGASSFSDKWLGYKQKGVFGGGSSAPNVWGE